MQLVRGSLFSFGGVSRRLPVRLDLGRLFFGSFLGRSLFLRSLLGLGFFHRSRLRSSLGSHILRGLVRNGSLLRRSGRLVPLHAPAANQSPHPLGGLRALSQPVIDPVQGQLQMQLPAGRDGVVETQALDKPAVALVAPVGNDDVIKGSFLGPVTGKPYAYHAEWSRGTRPLAGKPRIVANMALFALLNSQILEGLKGGNNAGGHEVNFHVQP